MQTKKCRLLPSLFMFLLVNKKCKFFGWLIPDHIWASCVMEDEYISGLLVTVQALKLSLWSEPTVMLFLLHREIELFKTAAVLFFTLNTITKRSAKLHYIFMWEFLYVWEEKLKCLSSVYFSQARLRLSLCKYAKYALSHFQLGCFWKYPKSFGNGKMSRHGPHGQHTPSGSILCYYV